MNFINSLSPTRKKGLVAAAILLVIALVIVVGAAPDGLFRH